MHCGTKIGGWNLTDKANSFTCSLICLLWYCFFQTERSGNTEVKSM